MNIKHVLKEFEDEALRETVVATMPVCSSTAALLQSQVNSASETFLKPEQHTNQIYGPSILDSQEEDESSPVYMQTVLNACDLPPPAIVYSNHISWRHILKHSSLRWPVILAIMVYVSRPLGAPDITNFYSTGILISLGE